MGWGTDGRGEDLSARDGVDDVDVGAGIDRRVEALQITDLFGLEEDVHERTELARFVAEVEAQPRIVVLQGFNDLSDRTSPDAHTTPAAGAGEERAGDRDGDGLLQYSLLFALS